LLSAAALSNFLTKLVKSSEVSRAKIIATARLPLLQTRQFFCPTSFLFTGLKECNGVNGVGDSPTCRPDLGALSSANALHASSALARVAPVANRCIIMVPLWCGCGIGEIPPGHRRRLIV